MRTLFIFALFALAEISSPQPLPVLHKVPWNGLAKTPPMGWNSWNRFKDGIDDKTIRQIADAIVRTGMKNAGYLYVNIDDTWQGQRDSSGKIHPNSRFPDMKALADYVHEQGLLIGIYSSPGPKTCAEFEGSFHHEEQDAATYNEWGMDYLKYDWCSARQVYKDTEMQAAYQKMGELLAIQSRPIVFSLCQYGEQKVWTWGQQVGANLWRTTGDIEDTWESMSKIGFGQASLPAFAGPGHWNDPDMLEVGNGGMTDEEYKTHMSLWSMLSAPLLAGNDLRSMSKRTLEILTNTEIIALDRDSLGQQATPKSISGDQEIWIKHLAKDAVAVALFNRGPKPVSMEIKWTDILPGKGHPVVRDLWRHEFLNVTSDNQVYSTTVPRHGTSVFRVSRL